MRETDLHPAGRTSVYPRCFRPSAVDTIRVPAAALQLRKPNENVHHPVRTFPADTSAMARPCVPSAKNHLRRVSIPGILAEVVRLRWEEFRYPAFSPFGLEMICFDLRRRVPHDVSVFIAQEPPEVQAAVDRVLVRQYREGPERNGILVQAACCEIVADARTAPIGSFVCARHHVRYSDILAPCIEERWRELGYAKFSDYVTGLIRYDLMLLGPHKYFSGDDTDPHYLAKLDHQTAATFHSLEPKDPIFLARLIEQRAGQPLTEEARRARMRDLAKSLIARALEADRRAKQH
jgi:hypothetical protein